MNIPKEFKGKIYFYMHVNGYIVVHDSDGLTGHKDYALLGETEELHVKFSDCRAALAESIDAKIEAIRAQIAVLQGQKASLLAIECDQ